MILVTHNDRSYPVIVEHRTSWRGQAGPWLAHLAEHEERDGTPGWVLHDDIVEPGCAMTCDEAVGLLAARIAETFPTAILRTDHDLTAEQVDDVAERWRQMQDEAEGRVSVLAGDAAIGMVE